ncbi:MAG: S8 family serine peptidase [Coriobacteriales bacterium]|jgi:hypothetical protein|nr:S8 family serine peptidase [Coriobacteriales bacterium]
MNIESKKKWVFIWIGFVFLTGAVFAAAIWVWTYQADGSGAEQSGGLRDWLRPKQATQPSPVSVVPESYLLTLRPQAGSAQALRRLKSRLGLRSIELLDAGSPRPMALVRVGSSRGPVREDIVVKQIMAQPEVLACEPERSFTPAFTATDPGLMRSDKTGQWYLNQVHAQRGWAYLEPARLAPVSVAVLDTGVRLTHRDLASNLDFANARDCANQVSRYGGLIGSYRRPDRQLTSAVQGFHSGQGNGDINGHGSHVAGLIAARAGNGFGMAGISANATILPIKVFHPAAKLGIKSDAQISCSSSSLVKAYGYLIRLKEQGMSSLRVINLSLGSYDLSFSKALSGLIGRAQKLGMLTVCAAGNDDSSKPFYPAQIASCLSVAATERSGGRAAYSNHSAAVDLSAPGGEGQAPLYSTAYGSDEAFSGLTGTSQAAALVSGAAAWLWRINPNLSVAKVKSILLKSVDDLGAKGRDQFYGYGRLNLERATVFALSGGRVAAPKLRLNGAKDGGFHLKKGKKLSSLLESDITPKRFSAIFHGKTVAGRFKWTVKPSTRPTATKAKGRQYGLSFQPNDQLSFKKVVFKVRLYVK